MGVHQLCVPCPKCREAQGMNAECRSYPPYHKHDILPKCVPCVDGLGYSEHESSEVCDPCADPCSTEINRHETRNCTRSHNRICECIHGYFAGVTGSCDQQCCYCDQQTHSEKKCERDQMPNNMFCHPTRDDGICDDRTLKPTPISITNKTTSSVPREATTPNVPSTATTPNPQPMKTTRQPTPSTSTSHGDIQVDTPNNGRTIVIVCCVIGGIAVVLLLLLLYYYCCWKKYSGKFIFTNIILNNLYFRTKA